MRCRHQPSAALMDELVERFPQSALLLWHFSRPLTIGIVGHGGPLVHGIGAAMYVRVRCAVWVLYFFHQPTGQIVTDALSRKAVRHPSACRDFSEHLILTVRAHREPVDALEKALPKIWI